MTGRLGLGIRPRPSLTTSARSAPCPWWRADAAAVPAPSSTRSSSRGPAGPRRRLVPDRSASCARSSTAPPGAAASAARGTPSSSPTAMEGEPASSKDAVLLAHSPHLVLDGISLAAAHHRRDRRLHRGPPRLAARCRVLDDAPSTSASRRGHRCPAHPPGDPARPLRGERGERPRALGRRRRRPRPSIPIGRSSAAPRAGPTLVQNVETLAHLALIARHGGAWFASVGAPARTRHDARHRRRRRRAAPGVVEVPTGTPGRRRSSTCAAADRARARLPHRWLRRRLGRRPTASTRWPGIRTPSAPPAA